jgi:nucleoside-diphosphate-sugar epimerase
VKILVTGATGIVGRRLVPILLGNGHEVIGLARDPERRQRLTSLGAIAVDADLFAPDSLRRAAMGCDAVVNLATHMPASSSQMMRRSAWKENDRVRKQGSANLVNAAIGERVVRFVQESFAPVYPDCGDRWIEEDTPLEPVRYNRTVVDAESSADRFTKAGGTGVVLRFGWFYGPDSRFLIEAIRQVRRGRSPLPGAADGFFSSVSHDDAATAAAAALSVPAGAYNVVDDEPVTRREYLHSLAQALGVPPPKPVPGWMKWLLGSLGELMARSQRISNRKLKSVSSWTPKYPSVREGWPAVVAGLPKSEGKEAA